MRSSLLRSSGIFVAVGIVAGGMPWIPAQAQESHWAAVDESTATYLIKLERRWAEAVCTHNGIQKQILADDFYGTAPDGSWYSKADVLAHADSRTIAETCTMYEVKVHLFGDTMAILYGSESAVKTETDGRAHTVKLTWTDTWLKRRGIWQIVAAQDMPSDMK